jgi:hypothetical protein
VPPTLSVELEAKRLELLHGVVPRATTMGALIRPTNPNVERQSKDLEAAARNFGLKLEVLTAGVEGDFDGALRSRPICRFSNPRRSSWSSISAPRRRSASRSRSRSSPGPTR